MATSAEIDSTPTDPIHFYQLLPEAFSFLLIGMIKFPNQLLYTQYVRVEFITFPSIDHGHHRVNIQLES